MPRSLVFVGLAIVIGLSFFTRHLVGMRLAPDGRYTPLVYNPASIRTQPPVRYSFKPEDVSWDETRAYARYAQEMLRGELVGANGDSFNPYLSQGQLASVVWYRDRLGSAVVAAFARLFGGSVPRAFLIADIVLPTAVAFALLLLCRQFRFGAPLSVLAVSLVMWFNWQDVLGLMQYLGGDAQNSAIFMRTPYPQVSSLIFVVFLIALMVFHRYPSWRSTCLLSLSLVLNMYSYFYSWSFAVTMVGVYGLCAVLGTYSRTAATVFPTHPRARVLVWVALAAAVFMTVPVWLQLLSDSQVFRDSFIRVHGEFTHAPAAWRHTIALSMLFLVSIGLPGKGWPSRWVWVVFWGTSLIVLNQQVLTGKTNQPAHYIGYVIEPFALLFVCDLARLGARWIERSHPRVPLRLLVLMTVVCVFVAGLTQNVYKLWRGAYDASSYNVMDDSMLGLISFMQSAELTHHGFLSNDDYLSQVLPAYLSQKPLGPWYGDPLSNADIDSLSAAARLQFGSVIGPASTDLRRVTTSLRLDPRKVLLILNRHKPNYRTLEPCEIAYTNDDFVVARALPCSPATPR